MEQNAPPHHPGNAARAGKRPMSERVYLEDSYCRELTTMPSSRQCRDGRWLVRLERTIFRPEGGGQPAARGTINGLPLLALDEEDGDVIHALAGDPGPGPVELRLDFARRYDLMQQHTAQHMLSQILVRLYGAPTLSFAIGPEHSSIETGRPSYDDEEIAALEEEFARRAWESLAVRVFETDDVSGLGLRRAPKVRGRIRVVEIAGFDRSACGGTHVASSAELAPLKILRVERVRGNARLYYVAGGRALRDHRLKHEMAQRLQRLVTLSPAEIPGQVEALIGERDELRRQAQRARRLEMEREAAAAAAGGEPLVVREFAGADAAELRAFASAVMAAGRPVVAYSRSRPDNEALVVAGCGGGADLRPLAAPFFALLAGKGGGSAVLIEGRASDLSRLPEALALLGAATAPRA